MFGLVYLYNSSEAGDVVAQDGGALLLLPLLCLQLGHVGLRFVNHVHVEDLATQRLAFNQSINQ